MYVQRKKLQSCVNERSVFKIGNGELIFKFKHKFFILIVLLNFCLYCFIISSFLKNGLVLCTTSQGKCNLFHFDFSVSPFVHVYLKVNQERPVLKQQHLYIHVSILLQPLPQPPRYCTVGDSMLLEIANDRKLCRVKMFLVMLFVNGREYVSIESWQLHDYTLIPYCISPHQMILSWKPSTAMFFTYSCTSGFLRDPDVHRRHLVIYFRLKHKHIIPN